MIHGVDFSGAQDAGRRIWISSGITDGGRLTVTQTRPASELPGGSRGRDATILALRAFILDQGGAIGLDFPFGLPRPIVAEPTWKEFVLAFNTRYPSADAFREGCQALSKREIRRATDKEARTPWAAWNLRLFRQTYYGIGALLAPLVREGRVRVLPMQRADGGSPWLLEICPASTLKRLGLAGLAYKGGASRKNRAAREQILGGLMRMRRLAMDPIPMARAVEDPGGDAVDSIVAVAAVYEAVSDRRLIPAGCNSQIEGHVYF